jgi:hypothetical protein
VNSERDSIHGALTILRPSDREKLTTLRQAFGRNWSYLVVLKQNQELVRKCPYTLVGCGEICHRR